MKYNFRLSSDMGGKKRVCQKCGKEKWSHQANTLACPVGPKTRIGYISFHKGDVYEEKGSK